MPNELPEKFLAFDVYGTLIDPFRMEEYLRADFGERAREASELWRSTQLEYSFRRALMKRYEPFHVCMEEALQFVGARLGVSLSKESRKNLMARYRDLPAYPDAATALAEFASRKFRVAAFSNGTEAAVRGALESAGLSHHFSKIVSVDPLRTFKPDPAVYESLAAEARTAKENVWVISSNPFDVIGAKSCGLRAAWVQRDLKRVFDPWGIEPDVTVHNLADLPGVLQAL